MKEYNVGFNDYWRTASVSFYKVPLGLRVLEDFVTWICDILGRTYIPLPPLPYKIKDKDDWDCMNTKDGWVKSNSWYESVDVLFHLFVCVPTHNFVWKHTKVKTLNLSFDFAKEMFPEEYKRCCVDYTFWDGECNEEDWEHLKRAEKLSRWVDRQFREVYKKSNWDYMKDSMRE